MFEFLKKWFKPKKKPEPVVIYCYSISHPTKSNKEPVFTHDEEQEQKQCKK
jgi:hypothetical protein